MAAAVVISILANAKQAQATIDNTASRMQRLGQGFRKMALPAAAAITAIGGVAKSSIDAASASEQSIGATEQIFKQYADTVVARSKQAADAIGVSANEYRELSNVTGAMLKNSGMPLKQVAARTDQLTQRAADLAATYGGTTKEAIESVSSLLRGEADPIEKYGVSIKQSDVNARLAAKGLTGLEGAAKKQAEQQARLKLLFEQTGDAAGQFARESGTAEQAAQKNKARLADLRAEIGGKLLPAWVKVQEVLATVAGFLAKHSDAAIVAGVAIAGLAAGVLAVNAAMAVGNAAMAVSTAVTAAWAAAQRAATAASLGTRIGLAALAVQTAVTSAVTKAAAAAQWLLNAAMAANPVMLVVLAIAALVAIFVVAYKKSETFRKIVNKSWAAIKSATSAVWGFIKKLTLKTWNAITSAVTGAVNAVKSVVSAVWNAIRSATTSAMNTVKSVVSAAWNAVKSATSSIWNGIKSAVKSGIDTVVSTVKGLKSKVTGALSGAASWLWSAGQDIISGLIDGIESMIGTVRDKLSSLTGLIPDWKGPPRRDRRLLRPTGRWIIRGLVRGFTDGFKGVKNTLETVTKRIKKILDRRFDGRTLRRQTRRVMRSLRDERRALRRNGRAQDRNARKIENARKRLKDAIKTRRDYAKAVRESIIDTGDITGLDTGHMNTPGAMITQLRDRVTQAREFSALIKSLTRQGLNKTSIQQLLDAGVSGGMSAAKALASGGKAAIDEVNQLTRQLARTGKQLGNRTANTMHQAGVQAARGLVRGLNQRNRALNRAARRLARKLARAVRRALRIKSPSRVFADIGRQTIAGLEVGLDAPGLKNQGRKLAAALQEGFATPDLAAAATGTGGTGGNTYNITVNAPVGSSSAEIGRALTKHIGAYERAGGRRPRVAA